MPKFQPSWQNQVERLTTFRAGVVENQDDADRNELFSDPTPYFSLRSQFGLDKSEYQQFSDTAKVAFRPTTGGPDMKTIARTNGKRGPSEREAREAMFEAPPATRFKGGRRGRSKKR